MKHHRMKPHAIAWALLMAYPAQFALAQNTEPSTDRTKKDSAQLETVVITGTRRLENIRDVPQAVSAINSETLETLGASGQDIRALSGRVPSLNVESDFGRSTVGARVLGVRARHIRCPRARVRNFA